MLRIVTGIFRRTIGEFAALRNQICDKIRRRSRLGRSAVCTAKCGVLPWLRLLHEITEGRNDTCRPQAMSGSRNFYDLSHIDQVTGRDNESVMQSQVDLSMRRHKYRPATPVRIGISRAVTGTTDAYQNG